MKYTIPESITTDRLILRKPLEKDWKELLAYYSDEICMKYTYGRAMEDWESWRQVALMIGHWEIRNYGPYVIKLKSTKEVMGITGLWFPLGWPETEIKWGLTRSFWGNGYAREGAEAVHKMAAIHLPELHLISLILSDNNGSIGVATSIGAVYEETIPFRGKEAAIYRHSSRK